MLVFLLVTMLLIADALIFFFIGMATDTVFLIKKMREKGWTVEPPEVGKE